MQQLLLAQLTLPSSLPMHLACSSGKIQNEKWEAEVNHLVFTKRRGWLVGHAHIWTKVGHSFSIKNRSCKKVFPLFNSREREREVLGGLQRTQLSVSTHSGMVAERVDLRLFLSIGMVLSGAFCAMFGLGYTFDIHVLWYYILAQASLPLTTMRIFLTDFCISVTYVVSFELHVTVILTTITLAFLQSSFYVIAYFVTYILQIRINNVNRFWVVWCRQQAGQELSLAWETGLARGREVRIYCHWDSLFLLPFIFSLYSC